MFTLFFSTSFPNLPTKLKYSIFESDTLHAICLGRSNLCSNHVSKITPENEITVSTERFSLANYLKQGLNTVHRKLSKIE